MKALAALGYWTRSQLGALGQAAQLLVRLVGMLPATLVYAWIGAGLAEIFARGGSPDLSAVLSPLVGLPFLVLAGLGLLTGWWRARRGGDGNAATGEGEERPAGRRRRRVRLRGRGSRP